MARVTFLFKAITQISKGATVPRTRLPHLKLYQTIQCIPKFLLVYYSYQSHPRHRIQLLLIKNSKRTNLHQHIHQYLPPRRAGVNAEF
ncbi:hypothetical protein AFLA_005774 [Aspergillus flavus NRRL3357]|nr:hypothetical protein AFLA_005774 [Aspergillus flavus NRRL3357]